MNGKTLTYIYICVCMLRTYRKAWLWFLCLCRIRRVECNLLQVEHCPFEIDRSYTSFFYVCMYVVHPYAYILLSMFECMYVCCMYVCWYVCMLVCMYVPISLQHRRSVSTHIHTYIYIHTCMILHM